MPSATCHVAPTNPISNSPPVVKAIIHMLLPFPPPPTPAGPTASRLGRYLTTVQLQASSFSSCLYMTGAAQNLLCLKLAAELGVSIANPFVTWIKVACVPCILMLLASPVVIYKLSPPGIQDTPEAPVQASEKLQAMGPMSTEQQIMLATLLGAVTLWVGSRGCAGCRACCQVPWWLPVAFSRFSAEFTAFYPPSFPPNTYPMYTVFYCIYSGP